MGVEEWGERIEKEGGGMMIGGVEEWGGTE